MSVEGLPQETIRFIRSCIHSVGQLEILILLQGCEPGALTPAQVNERLRSNIEAVEQRLAALVRFGLVAADTEQPGKFRFAPGSDELRASTSQLSDLYRNYPSRVIDTIYSAPDRMQMFSDAFRIIKDEGDTHG